MELTDRLYLAAKPIWNEYLDMPFVKELGQGTLSVQRFRFYMIQDYRYLLQYSKVFALGVIKADDEQLQRLFAQMVHDTLDGEMKVHKAYMERLGISNEEIADTKTSLTNQSYTSYMLDEAYKGGVLEILVAVLSCAWSYQMIGENHKNIPGALEHHLFGEWIRGYSCQQYCDSTQLIIDLVNKYGKGIDETREEHLKEMFVNCSRYEADFWNMAYNMND